MSLLGGGRRAVWLVARYRCGRGDCCWAGKGRPSAARASVWHGGDGARGERDAWSCGGRAWVIAARELRCLGLNTLTLTGKWSLVGVLRVDQQ